MDQLFHKGVEDYYHIRVTPEGEICVIDVIEFVCNTNRPFSVWSKFLTDHPEVLPDCGEYSFQPGEKLPVVHGEGWRLFLGVLPYYRSKNDFL